MPADQSDPVLADELKTRRGQTLTRIDSGEYDGETNDDGLRHGTGTCTWKDGSTYEGQWHEDVREGLGVFK